jgi:hypothetical protein
MGLNNKSRLDNFDMLSLKLFLFTYPGETGCCPNQPSKDANMVLLMTLN